MDRIVPKERVGEVLATARGLTRAEVERQLGRFGKNDILDAPAHPMLDLVRDTARDPMLWFLLGVGALYGLLGEILESAILLASAIPLVGMDAFLHRRTQASTKGLRARLAARASVLRDSVLVELAAEDLVPGDLAIVSANEAFPADGVLVEGEDLQVDESALTGEAYPVRKEALALRDRAEGDEIAVADRHWGLAGTRLLTGEARLRIVWTGESTLYGEIVRSARQTANARTPLQQAIGELVRFLLIAAAILCATLAIVRLWQGFGWLDALLSAVTLAVAAMPEEFPVIFTMFLGVGVYRLARRKALVRRAVSVENIGRVSCICSDKTGTITLGELQLMHWVTPNGSTVDAEESLRETAALASRRESGDPLDVAIFRAIEADQGSVPGFDVLAAFPFTEDRRRETAIAREASGLEIATKGAPETILAICLLSQEERQRWTLRASELAAEGHKVIACALRHVSETEWIGGEPDRDFAFAGLLALEDPIREGVPEAIARSRAAGIRVLIVTGDHPRTAHAVAQQLGLGGGSPRVVLGEELETLLSDGRAGVLADVDVIARARPAQKLAIVRAFQADGEIVAVTGDGVNDVPALQAADIGIAMGDRATRSAREIADIVLLDDNFRTIVRAIEEGRQLFENLKRSFRYLLMIHIPLVVTAALIPLAGYPILYLPIHVVWLELMIHPSAMLAFQDSADEGSLGHRRDRIRAGFFVRAEWASIVLVGTLVVVLVSYGYAASLGAPPRIGHARAMAMLILCISSAGFVAILSGLRTRASRWIVVVSVAFAGLLIQTPSIAHPLHLEPLHFADWVVALAGSTLACLPLLGAEGVHRLRRAASKFGGPRVSRSEGGPS